MKLALAGAAGFFVGVILVLILGAGGGGETKTVTVSASGKDGTVVVTTTVPRLVGEPLDVASDRVDRSGFQLVIDSGGGLFGPLIDSDWEVKSQDPAAGEKVAPGSTIHVDIDRR
jgi:beta-lactam-binding protein with PASTA domain